MEKNALTPSFLKQHYYSKYINLYSVLIVLVVLFMGFFIYDKYDEYVYKTTSIEAMNVLADSLKSDKENIVNDMAKTNEEYADQMKKIEKAIDAVFPDNENYTDIIREFDKFFQEINSVSNPAIVTSVKFDNAVPDKTNSYKILPFNVNLNVTKDNFDKFLKYVYESGSLDNARRLIEIKSFSLSIPNEKSGKTLTLNVKMEAYIKNNEWKTK